LHALHHIKYHRTAVWLTYHMANLLHLLWRQGASLVGLLRSDDLMQPIKRVFDAC
jgi:hypothetical protein